jgi:hypothetical protein
MTAPQTDYDLELKIDALRRQVAELERERNRNHNLLFVTRFVLTRALEGIGVQGKLGSMTDGELIALLNRHLQLDWRFSRCPNASQFKCRPSALQTTRDGDLVACEDCGWSILHDSLDAETQEITPVYQESSTEKPATSPKPASDDASAPSAPAQTGAS